MAYLLLIGASGSNERWEIQRGQEDEVAAQLRHVGTETTGELPLVDPGSEQGIQVFLAWNHFAAAAIVPSPTSKGELRGQYA